MYQSPFNDFSFIEYCKVHKVPLQKYAFGDACPKCINKDFLCWEGNNEPFIHKSCLVSCLAQNPREFYNGANLYASFLQPRQRYYAMMQDVKQFISHMSNQTKLYLYEDDTTQPPRSGYLLLRNNKIIANITIEKPRNAVRQSFV